MSKKLNYAILVMMLISVGCVQSNLIKNQDENYISPSIKQQPQFFYPKIAQENYYYGLTKVVVMISKTGKVDRTVVIKSSGHTTLDEAAIEYCKGLIFTPATKDGVPVESRIVWDVKYNFMDQNWNTNDYWKLVQALYDKTKIVNKDDRLKIEKEILEKHSEFISRMNDAINFNNIVEKVISPKLSEEWKNNWNTWPLSFLLYYDFIERFPEFDSINVVKTKLKDAINNDIQYILKQPTTDAESKKAKEDILTKIKMFFASHYPDVVLDNTSNYVTKTLNQIS
jgi:TonB family protein